MENLDTFLSFTICDIDAQRSQLDFIALVQGKSLEEADPNYALSDPVAANVGVMDKKDNYVSVVTSLNTWFGSKVKNVQKQKTLYK